MTYKIYKTYLTMMIASTFSTIQLGADDTFYIYGLINFQHVFKCFCYRIYFTGIFGLREALRARTIIKKAEKFLLKINLT